MRESSILSRPAGFLFLSPAFLFIAAFLIYPFISIVLLSFTNQAIGTINNPNTRYIGLENYQSLLNFATWLKRGELGWSLLISAQFVVGSALIGQAGWGCCSRCSSSAVRGCCARSCLRSQSRRDHPGCHRRVRVVRVP